jgi:hypothetical protein
MKVCGPVKHSCAKENAEEGISRIRSLRCGGCGVEVSAKICEGRRTMAVNSSLALERV